jgi:hypothetical protein
LFVTDSSVWQKLDQDDDLIALHKAVHDITQHINVNGGWTILGWIHSGQVKDQSSATNMPDSLASLYPKPHISYLFPLQPAVAMDKPIQQHQLTKTSNQP